MAKDQNVVILDGRLCFDNKVFTASTGSKIIHNTVAYNKKYLKGGVEVKETTFVKFNTFGAASEKLEQFKKGDLVHIEGELHTNTWKDKKTGDDRSELAVIAWVVESLINAPKPESKPQGTPSTPHKDPVDAFDDDIPF